MDKVTALYIINELLFSHKKNEIMSFSGKWMKVLRKISQTQEDKSYVFTLISSWMIFKTSIDIRQGETCL